MRVRARAPELARQQVTRRLLHELGVLAAEQRRVAELEGRVGELEAALEEKGGASESWRMKTDAWKQKARRAASPS